MIGGIVGGGFSAYITYLREGTFKEIQDAYLQGFIRGMVFEATYGMLGVLSVETYIASLVMAGMNAYFALCLGQAALEDIRNGNLDAARIELILWSLNMIGVQDHLRGSNHESSPSRIEQPDGNSPTVRVGSLDDFINNPKILGDTTPGELYTYLQENGYNPSPLSKGDLKGLPYKQGGGYIVRWGGDHALEYRPGGLNHHGGKPYYRLSSGKTGRLWFDMNGNRLPY
jgi:hypothetical protein